ncbi:SDR family NAD(P)-dependent oxidoreductase [Halomarina halobia]|uniref:SDR family NAD(P)-dependent oxidoreductase n=1 Tax=Halomarina halobia TaxID=3033386 RepID=A0ABD6AF01_9EURY|nr:SDR family NAD(P)-dependent oxidoreductase [Halomarina sp. PSR21]
MFEDGLLEGETAVVTGASRGIGRTTAMRLAEAGANVVAAARSADMLEDVVAEIEAETAAEAMAVPVDVRDEEGVHALAKEATVFGDGSVEVLVANAGANFHVPVAEMSLNAWKTIVDINLNGTFLTTTAFADALADAETGRVVTMGSVVGRDGAAESAHYASSKAGIELFTRTLAMEWGERNVRVNCVRPGLVATPGVEENRNVTAGDIDRTRVERDIGHPSEIADLVLFLVSPAASYITGQTYTAEGVPESES